MTSAQLAEWEAYLRIEPPHDQRLEYLIGELLAMTGNINRDTESKPEPFTRLDFMPWMEKPAPKAAEQHEDLNPELQATRLRALFKGN